MAAELEIFLIYLNLVEMNVQWSSKKAVCSQKTSGILFVHVDCLQVNDIDDDMVVLEQWIIYYIYSYVQNYVNHERRE
jgi:hypothetical protein